MLNDAKATEQREHVDATITPSPPEPCGPADGTAGDGHEESCGKPRAVVQRQPGREQPGKSSGNPVKERRFLHERLTRHGGHDPVAGFKEVVDRSKNIGLVRLPRIMTHESWQ